MMHAFDTLCEFTFEFASTEYEYMIVSVGQQAYEVSCQRGRIYLAQMFGERGYAYPFALFRSHGIEYLFGEWQCFVYHWRRFVNTETEVAYRVPVAFVCRLELYHIFVVLAGKGAFFSIAFVYDRYFHTGNA